MTGALIVVIGVLLVALVAALVRGHPRRAGRAVPEPRPRRILFPFLAAALSHRALDAALRLARAEQATLVPVFLAQVPMALELETSLPGQGVDVIATQEAIEQRAAAFGVPVDARIQRGRTARHALRRAIVAERHDRIVIAAAVLGADGFAADDVAWLLTDAPGELVVVRPAEPDDLLEETAERLEAARRAGERPAVAVPAPYGPGD